MKRVPWPGLAFHTDAAAVGLHELAGDGVLMALTGLWGETRAELKDMEL